MIRASGQADNTETWEETKDKVLHSTLDELWNLEKILSNKKCRLSWTNKKNNEANAKVHDLNQKTMQALNTVAVVYAAFEQAGANLEVENSEADMLHADVRAAMEEFDDAQQNQERMRGELKDSQKGLDSASVVFKESNRNLEDAGKRLTETKWEADDAHDQLRAHGRLVPPSGEVRDD